MTQLTDPPPRHRHPVLYEEFRVPTHKHNMFIRTTYLFRRKGVGLGAVDFGHDPRRRSTGGLDQANGLVVGEKQTFVLSEQLLVPLRKISN